MSLYKAWCHHCPCITINGLQHLCDMAVDGEIHVELVFRSQHEDESERKADRETQVCDSYLCGIAPSANRIHILRERQERKTRHHRPGTPLSTSISPWLEIEPCPTKTYSSLDLPSSQERRDTTSVVKMCSSKATVYLYIHQPWLDTPVALSITDSV